MRYLKIFILLATEYNLFVLGLNWKNGGFNQKLRFQQGVFRYCGNQAGPACILNSGCSGDQVDESFLVGNG
jgi:hypothetical protein